MYIEKTYKPIKFNEAKRMFQANERVFYLLDGWEYRSLLDDKYLTEEYIKDKTFFKEVFIEHPNSFVAGALIVDKLKDSTYKFTVSDDYDIYEAEIDNCDKEELIEFLLLPYVESK